MQSRKLDASQCVLEEYAFSVTPSSSERCMEVAQASIQMRPDMQTVTITPQREWYTYTSQSTCARCIGLMLYLS